MDQRCWGLALTLTLFLWIGVLGPATPGRAATVNHEIWADLLGKYITPDGVDYTGFKKE